MKSIFDDYPTITSNWLDDNKSFIKYVNGKVNFNHLWHSSIFAWNLKEYFQMIDEQNKNKQKEQQKEMEKIEGYKNLLEVNRNLILHGAPGTGKTHTAKDIAAQMICGKSYAEVEKDEALNKQFNEQTEFVQFHPSYDYSDFVEGLRPIEGDNRGDVGFERKDGVFKEFCERALENLTESEKFKNAQKSGTQEIAEVHEILSQYFDYIENKIFEFDGKMIDFSGEMKIRKISRTNKGPESIEISTAYDSHASQNLSAKIFYRDYIDFKNGKITSYKDVKPTFESKSKYHGNARYYFKLYQLVSDFEKSEDFDKSTLKGKIYNEVKLKNFIFIIDEINRGEMSKIFGELFFSIDPDYRGRKGKVRTQYANMLEETNDFDDALGIVTRYGHFFVPENVYIIGTMNDIDRSVDSMDFAMRRRFTFMELKANECLAMLDGLQLSDYISKDDIIAKMTALNSEIEKIPGLSSAYHIGGSYFAKLSKYADKPKDEAYKCLWNNHLKPLLTDYLRGLPNLEAKLSSFKTKYDEAEFQLAKNSDD